MPPLRASLIPWKWKQKHYERMAHLIELPAFGPIEAERFDSAFGVIALLSRFWLSTTS